jgi:DNA-binding phage protein
MNQSVTVNSSIEITQEVMQQIYKDDNFVKNYYKTVNHVVKQAIGMETIANKKFIGKNTLTISLRCKTCRNAATLTTKTFRMNMNPVVWDYTATCSHYTDTGKK